MRPYGISMEQTAPLLVKGKGGPDLGLQQKAAGRKRGIHLFVDFRAVRAVVAQIGAHAQDAAVGVGKPERARVGHDRRIQGLGHVRRIGNFLCVKYS